MKGESGGNWPAAPPAGWRGAGQGRGMGARQIPALCHTRGHTKGAPNLLGKDKGEEKRRFYASTALSRLFFSECLPCPRSPLSGRFLSSFKTHCSHVTCSMESSLTGRRSGPFHELPEAPSLPSIILYCPCLLLCLTPHFKWGQKQACHSPGCPVSDLGPQQARMSMEQMRGKWPGGHALKAPGEAKTPAWPQLTDQQPRPGPGGLLALFSSPLCPQL